MAEKVRIFKIVIGGDGQPCRVILTDGKELDGLTSVRPGEITVCSFLTVQIEAVLSPSQESERD